MCKFTDVIDGTLDLADVALINDYLAMIADNETIAATPRK